MDYFAEMYRYAQKLRYAVGQWKPEEQLEKKFKHKIIIALTPAIIKIQELKQLKDMPDEDDSICSPSITVQAD